MKTKIVLLIIILMSAITGCSTQRPPIVNSTTGVLGTGLSFDYQNKNATNYYINVYNAAQSPEKKIVRNRIIAELMGLIDADYNKFERMLRTERAGKDTIMTWISLGLTGTASFSSKSVANILAAIDTGTKGGNEAFDKNMYGDKAPEFLLNTMRSNRLEIEAIIYDKMAKEDDAYTLQDALRDVSHYYYEGFVTSALVRLNQMSAEKVQVSEFKVSDAKSRLGK